MTDDNKVPLTTGDKMIGWLAVNPETLEITGKFLGAEYAQFVREGLRRSALFQSRMQIHTLDAYMDPLRYRSRALCPGISTSTERR